MRHESLQFEPVRRSIYTSAELYAGFDPAVPDSWRSTCDFRIYREFQEGGGSPSSDPYTAMLHAMHDASMTQLTAQLIEHDRVVAMMGGHRVRRDDPAYVAVAELAAELARRGYLVTTGGGPGAMEAGHLGASLAHAGGDRLGEAIRELSRRPAMPKGLGEIVPDGGGVDDELARLAHEWFVPAWEISLGGERTRSLSVPTWHYGHEPSTPLATHIAKLFQNSIREDGLLAIATHGVIYAPGAAGTVQEVFQDAAQNFYESYGDRASPMVLLGVEFWTETLPADGLLRALFGTRYDDIVHVTDDLDVALEFIESARPVSSALMRCLPDATMRPERY